MRTALILTILFLTSCSSLNKFERRANHGDVNACDLLVHLLNEKMDLEGKSRKIEDKIYKYSKLCLKLDTGNWYKGYHYLQLAESYLTNKSDSYYYYYKAAQLGEAIAQYVIAISYYDGHPPGIIPKSHEDMESNIKKDSAFYWYQMAALSSTEGSYIKPCAYSDAANMLYTGKYIKADTIKAIYYYKKACSCCKDYHGRSACDSVIAYYKRQKLKDTTEIMIYNEFAEPMRQVNLTK